MTRRIAALSAVVDPELDEPITDLGFVRSLVVTPAGNVKVHLRLPTSFCSPNFAYLMASDAKDVLSALDWTRRVVVELDDHHDSEIINAGLAADAGYRGTFGHEAEESLDELRETFRRKAHTAAMERCLTALLRADPQRGESSLGEVRLGDLPDDDTTAALLRRRRALGLPTAPDDLVMVESRGPRLLARRCPDRAAAGALDADLHRRQRALLPRAATYPLSRQNRRTHPERRSTPMSTMRAVQVVGYHQNLEMKEVPAPDAHRTVRRRRQDRRRGGVPHRSAHPRRPVGGEDAACNSRTRSATRTRAGCDAVGSAVTNVSEGDKVIVHPLITCGLCRACRSGDDVHCEASAFPGIDTNGGYADYLKTSARSVVKIDDSLEPSDVAALADAGLTAYHAAAKAARRLTPRDRCVIIGAGGLGHIGIQVLKALAPAELIVVDRNAEALKLAESIGADHGVLADGSQVEQVLELTGGNGAEAVVDFVGEGGATSEGVRDAAPRRRLPRRRATARTSTCRRSTSSPPRSTSSATWSGPTTTCAT